MAIPATFPEKVREELRSQILGACDLAAEGFNSAKGREDAVTGALGERLRLKEKLVAVDGDGTWRFSISWNKFRNAKGRSGEEREIGADGIIQFELFSDYGEEVYTKGLLFQSKMDDDRDYRRLHKQCENMEAVAKNCSAVIQYSEDGYMAMDGSQALGQFNRVASTMPDFEADGKHLGKYITDRFLTCEVGQEKLYYEHKTETLFVPTRNSAYIRLRTKLNKISVEVYSPRRRTP
jgi:hypothetical protein